MFTDPSGAWSAVEALQAQGHDPSEMYALVRAAGGDAAAANGRLPGLPATGKLARQFRKALGRSHKRDFPDLGRIVAFNPQALAMLQSALAHIGAGGLRVALQDQGMESHLAEAYHQALEQGMFLLFVRTPADRALAASNVLEQHGGRSVFIYSTVPT
jgi:hypothetical protein